MIGRRSTLIYIANLMGAVLGYVGLFVIYRFIPNAQEMLGIVVFGLGLVGSFFVLAGLGIPAAHIKRVSQGEPLDHCIGTFALLKVLQTGLAISVTLLALYVWTEVLGRGFETPLHLQVVMVMIIYHTAISLSNIGVTTFNARLETAKGQTSTFIGTATRVAGMIIVAVVVLGALALAWAYVLGAVAVAVSTFVLLRHYPISKPQRGLIRSYLKFAFPLAIPAVLVGLSTNIDKVAIQLFWGAADVGYYFTAQRLILLLTVVTSAVSLLLFPFISRLHVQNDHQALRTKIRQAERYLSMILAPVVAFLIVYPRGVIHILLSDTALPAAAILRIFALATFVLALIVPRRALLQGMDRSDLAGLATLAGAVTTLALYPILIPTSIFGFPFLGLGPEGAAFGVLTGNVFLLTLVLLFSHRLVGDWIQARVAIHVAAAAAVAIVFFLLLPPILGLEWRWYDLVLVSGIFLGAYLAILAAVREFRKRDLLLFLSILDPRKMARYVRDELRSKEIK